MDFMGIALNPAASGSTPTETTAAEQFTVADDRTPAQVAAAIVHFGHEPVWKDSDASFTG